MHTVTAFCPGPSTTTLTVTIAIEAYESASNVTHINWGRKRKYLRHEFVLKFLREHRISLDMTKVRSAIKALDRRSQKLPLSKHNITRSGRSSSLFGITSKS